MIMPSTPHDHGGQIFLIEAAAPKAARAVKPGRVTIGSAPKMDAS
jgi:hypothetical protein